MARVETIDELIRILQTPKEKGGYGFYYKDDAVEQVGRILLIDDKRIEEIRKSGDGKFDDTIKIMEELGLKEPDSVTKTGRRVWGKLTTTHERIKNELSEIYYAVKNDSAFMDIANYILMTIYLSGKSFSSTLDPYYRDYYPIKWESKFGINENVWDVTKLKRTLRLYFVYMGYIELEKDPSEKAIKKGEELFKSWFKKNEQSLRENVRKIFEESPRLTNQFLKELLNLPENKLPERLDISCFDTCEEVDFSIRDLSPYKEHEELGFDILFDENILNIVSCEGLEHVILNLLNTLSSLEISLYYNMRTRRYNHRHYYTNKDVIIFLKDILKECDFDYTHVTLSDLEYEDRIKALEYLALNEIKELFEKKDSGVINTKEIFDKYKITENIVEILKDMSEKGIIKLVDVYDFTIPDTWNYSDYINNNLRKTVKEKLESLKMKKNRKTAFYDIQLTKNSKGDSICWNPLEEKNWHLAILGNENMHAKVVETVKELLAKLEKVETKPTILIIDIRNEYKDYAVSYTLDPINADIIVNMLDKESKVVLQLSERITSKEANEFLNKLFNIEKLRDKTNYPKMYIIQTHGDTIVKEQIDSRGGNVLKVKEVTNWMLLNDNEAQKKLMETYASHGIGCIYVSTDSNQLNLERAQNLNIPTIVVENDKLDFISTSNKN